MSLHKVGAIYYYDFIVKRRRYKASTHEKKVTRAREVERLKKDEVRRGIREIRDIPFSLPEDEKDPKALGLCEQYLKVHAATKKAPSFYEHTIRVLKREFKQRMLSEITPADVDAFMAERRATVKAATANRTLVVLKHMFKLAIRWGYMKENPAAEAKLVREPRAREVFLTPDQAQALLVQCSPWLRSLVVTALYTGGRMSELIGLRWERVDLERKLIRFIDTKNGEDRSIKIDSTLVEILKGLPSREKGRFRPDGEVFRGKGGEPIHRDGVTWPYRRALKKAGLERVRFHDLRHTAASWWVQAGVPLNTVRERLGHKSLAMTVRYAHLAPDHQDDCNAAVGAALSVGMGAHPQAPGGVGLRL